MERSSGFRHWLAGKGGATAASVVGVCIAVSGCTSLKELVVSTPVESKVAVATKCIKRSEIPPIPAFPLDVVDLSNPTQELSRLVNAATLEVAVRTKYVVTVMDLLLKCSD